jgi:hypothetical protein
MASTRLVVTGQTADGKSVFVSDSQVDSIAPSLVPGWEFHRLWGSDSPPSLPTDGSRPESPRYFPPPGGYRFGFFTVPPASTRLEEDVDVGLALEEFGRLLPGLADVMEPDHPGMHTTDTIDADVVVSGDVWLELDDGEEIHLQVGDVVIQNGTRHLWRNRSEEPAMIFVALLGAARAA